MSPPPELPLPVAALRRQSENAKSARDRHDGAYFAWELSVKLAFAAAPPEDATPFGRAPLGRWVGALRLPSSRIETPALLDLHGLLTEVATGKRSHKQSVAPRTLLDALVGYRNRVVGHGSVRAGAFYDDAGRALLDGLDAAWGSSLFLPAGARLLFCESAETSDGDGESGRVARILDLTGEAPRVLDPAGTPVGRDGPTERQLHLREADGTWRSLHPWVLLVPTDARERTYVFNGIGRTPEYLDYASGETLRGRALETAMPGIRDDLRGIFAPGPRAGAEAVATDGATESSFDDALSDPGDDDEDERPDGFGDYRLLGKLGEGGMGVVYLARQESLGRLVAVKMLPPAAADDPIAVARFRREVAALSRCDHPNVVKILASGAARGTHYYAMEYVEGADLARLARALTSVGDLDAAISSASGEVRAERSEVFADLPAVPRSEPTGPTEGGDRFVALARLFRDAARGVHHLHEAGIIHRDIKPGNVMVTEDGARAVVMDLGLAALADASRSLTRDATGVLGTLRYLAPEQLTRGRSTHDRRVDVYALGATLYELLTLRPMLAGDTEARLIEQVVNARPRPARELDPRVPTDLSTIVAKATEKAPGDRYDSAMALADDLDAFLEGRPIAARPPTLGYLLWLAVKRRKTLSATVAVFILVLIIATVAFVSRLRYERDLATEQRNFARDQRARAERERERAELERARAEEREAIARGSIRTLVHKARDQLATIPGGAIREAREALLLDAYDGLRRLQELEDADAVVFTLDASEAHRQIADLARLAGRTEEAIGHLRRGLEVSRALVAERPDDDAALADLAVSLDHWGTFLLQQGDLETAGAALVEAVAISRRRLAVDPGDLDLMRDLIVPLHSLGALREKEGRIVEAIAVFEETLALAKRRVPEERTELVEISRIRDVFQALLMLGDSHQTAGRLDRSRAYYEEALAEVEAHLAEFPGRALFRRDAAVCLENLGEVIADQGDLTTALAHHERSLRYTRQLWSLDQQNATSIRDLGLGLRRVGVIRWSLGGFDAAIRDLREAYGLLRGLSAADPDDLEALADVASTLVIYGRRLRDRGRVDDAVASFDEALLLTRYLLEKNPEHQEALRWRADALRASSLVRSRQGDMASALEAVKIAVETNRALAKAQPEDASAQLALAAVLVDAGVVHRNAGQLREALVLWDESVAIARAQHDLDGTSTHARDELVRGLENAASVRLELGELAAARAGAEEAIALGRTITGLDPANVEARRNTTFALNVLGELLRIDDDLDGALAAYEEAVETRREILDANPAAAVALMDLAAALERRGTCRVDRAELDLALVDLEEAAAIRRSLLAEEPDAPDRLRGLLAVLGRIGRAHLERRDFAACAAAFEPMVEIAKQLVATDATNVVHRRDLAVALQKLANARRNQRRLDEALVALRESLSISAELLELEPESATRIRDIAIVNERIGDILELQGDLETGLVHFERAVEVHGRLLERGGRYERELGYLQRRVQKAQFILAMLAGEVAPQNGSQWVYLAQALLERREHGRAADAFAVILADEQIRADIDGFHLYNGACAAAVKAASLDATDPDAAETWRQRALQWLGDDVRRRRDRLAALEATEAGDGEAETHAAALAAARDELAKHLAHARDADEDLAAIRARDEFAAIFAGGE